MGYDASHHHSRRDSNQPFYFEESELKMADTFSQSSDVPSRPSRSSSISQDARSTMTDSQRSHQSQSFQDRIPQPSTSAGGAPLPSNISPELIAQIAEQVTREVVSKLANNPNGNTKSQSPAPEAAERRRASSIKSASTSSPTPEARGVYTPPSPVQAPRRAPPPSGSPDLQPSRPTREQTDETMSSRYTEGRPSVDSNGSRMPRPTPARDPSTELSAVDQKWGRLFVNEHTPTDRLGQVLRGIANHIIECYEPKKTIVVTPEKMLAFYSSYALDNEVHPFSSIFAPDYHKNISQLYYDLGYQHHLVQKDKDSYPTVPGLTPLGFEQWMTKLILGYPEQESRRLQKVIVDMPVDADGVKIDGKPERLPKQISRHLLPKVEHTRSKKYVDEAISDFLDDVRIAQSKRPPPRGSSRPRQDSVDHTQGENTPKPPSTTGPPIERERMPYTGAPSAPPSEGPSLDEKVKIERERQPYVAQLGTGARIPSEDINTSQPQAMPRRSNSIRSPQRPGDYPISGSNGAYTHKPGTTRTRRPSSPPILSYSKSTPLNINESTAGMATSNFNPGSYGNPPHSAGFPPPPPLAGGRERGRERERDDDSYRTQPRDHRRSVDEDIRHAAIFTSPREAEKWDRTQEIRGADGKPAGSYEEYYRPSGRASDAGQYNSRYYT